jgi:hypothetical protein
MVSILEDKDRILTSIENNRKLKGRISSGLIFLA